ncbi:MAG: serine hydrolase domain-containing protein [Polaromonas sp.]
MFCTFPRFILVPLFALAAALPAVADHESAQNILEQPEKFKAIAHALKPSVAPKPLQASQNTALKDRIKAASSDIEGRLFSVLVFDKDEVVYENYANGAKADSQLSAYSMTKSFTSLAVGEALCSGKIKSLDDLAVTYVPELAGTVYGAASIKNLLRYTSGGPDPGGAGYSGVHDRNVWISMLQGRISLLEMIKTHGAPGRFKAGEKFIYNGLDSETLSLVVRAATGMSLPQWFESTVWQKSGAESAATWRVDKEGNGIAETYAFVSPRDAARIAMYVVDRLNDKSTDACMNAYVREAASPLVAKGYWGSAPHWGYALHTGADGNTWFFGHSAQRVGINRKTGRILVTNGFTEWSGFDANVQKLLAVN